VGKGGGEGRYKDIGRVEKKKNSPTSKKENKKEK
jgi:hypothetical protein